MAGRRIPTMSPMLLLAALALAAPLPPEQEEVRPAQEEDVARLLDAPVLLQDGVRHSAREVVTELSRWDPTLAAALEGNADYLRLYLDSPRFLEHVRAYSDQLLLDAAEVPDVEEDLLRREASAWARERSLPGTPDSALALAGIEIRNRARLLARQPEVFGTNRLRQHMLRSVPEFFGEMQISWIRIPLFDTTTGSVLPEDERRARYDTLDEAARLVEAGELEWEEAVERFSQDPVTKARKGKVGIVDRSMTSRYEEPFLRQLFADLGYRHPQGVLLRGPIMTARWVYLVRVEALVIRGVVELERVRPRVERSLRDTLIREELDRLADGVERHVLLPISR